eukprot:15465489-Alexandrium_andersonii.AAC.1
MTRTKGAPRYALASSPHVFTAADATPPQPVPPRGFNVPAGKIAAHPPGGHRPRGQLHTARPPP